MTFCFKYSNKFCCFFAVMSLVSCNTYKSSCVGTSTADTSLNPEVFSHCLFYFLPPAEDITSPVFAVNVELVKESEFYDPSSVEYKDDWVMLRIEHEDMLIRFREIGEWNGVDVYYGVENSLTATYTSRHAFFCKTCIKPNGSQILFCVKTLPLTKGSQIEISEDQLLIHSEGKTISFRSLEDLSND